MRVCLIGEGTYPVVRGGVSTWCDQLIHGMPDVDFQVTVLTAGRAHSVYEVPQNVRRVSAVDMWGPVPTRKVTTARQRAAFEEAWEVICGHAYGRSGRTTDVALDAWRVLTRPDIGERLWWLLNDGRSLAILSRIRGAAGQPTPSGRDLANSMAYVARMIMPCTFPPIEADVVHVTSLGSALLAALPTHHQGVPILLSEHGVYFRERLMALRATEWPFVQRNMVAAFLKAMARVGYEAAASIAPVSDFNGRWAQVLGADPDRVRTVHNGVDMARFPSGSPEPELPTIVYVGRIDPLKDLKTLVSAVPRIAARIPHVRVHLIGPVPEQNKRYARELEALIAELGVDDNVALTGPTSDPAAAYASSTIVVLSSVSEGFPYGALEPMACGRAVVATNVGGVPEVVGDAGMLVHARDPKALADACIMVLQDEALRHRLAEAGRQRVLEQFTLDRMLSQFRSRYVEIAGPVPAGAGIPAPRGETVPLGNRIDPYLNPQRDPEWAYALIRAEFRG